MITNKTQLNMVIGFPLEHTQSPILHNIIYEILGIDAVLLAFAHTQLELLIQTLKTLSIKLTAVTMPFKEEVLKYLDHVSPEVEALQAVNTIIQREGKLFGYNTDVAGIAFALRNTSLNNKSILIIGAGGAARAATYFLQKNQAKLLWLNRTEKNAHTLLNLFGGEVLDPKKIQDTPIDIIINTTPLGMLPNINQTPLPNYQFNKEQIVFDMVYNPIQTELLKQAKSHQAKIISGLDMFIGQGLNQIECWSNHTIATDEMVTRVKDALMASQIGRFEVN